MVGFFIITFKDTNIMLNDLLSWDTLQYVGTLITSIVTLASTITAVTDTPADTSIKSKIYKIIEFLALVNEKTKQR
jgi:hypothetical protein